MEKINILDKQKAIFAQIQMLANKLKKIEDEDAAGEGMTIRQWLLTLAISQFGDNPPSLGEVGELMGSTHQNVKQIALKLEKKGFLHIEKDIRDFRVIRFKLTGKSYSYWKRFENKFKELLAELFVDLSEEEISSLYDCLNKMYQGIMSKTKCLENRA